MATGSNTEVRPAFPPHWCTFEYTSTESEQIQCILDFIKISDISGTNYFRLIAEVNPWKIEGRPANAKFISSDPVVFSWIFDDCQHEGMRLLTWLKCEEIIIDENNFEWFTIKLFPGPSRSEELISFLKLKNHNDVSSSS